MSEYEQVSKEESKHGEDQLIKVPVPKKMGSISEKRKIILVCCLFTMFFLIVAVSIVLIVPLLYRETFEVALFGDSLVENTDLVYHISSNIQATLSSAHPNLAISVYSSGHGGNTILDLRNRYKEDVVERHSQKWLISGFTPPDVVIVYWDSDCSDDEETPQTINAIRGAYVDNLVYLLTHLQANIPQVIVAGPSLYGELPRGENSKDAMYDDYVAINRNVTSMLGIPYLNTRQAFFDNLPSNWRSHFGYLTLDGEHHNAAGAKIVQDMFLKALESVMSAL
jgi:hypothetical protein